MRPISILIVAIALVLAGLVYYTVPRMMNRPSTPAPEPAKIAAAEVMVAAHALPAGTILKADDVRWQAWPEEVLDPNYLVKSKGADPVKDAVGHVVLHGFETGEPITAQRLIKAGQAGFLAAALTPGMFAVSVPVNAITGVGGFVQPGDHVNVLLFEKLALKEFPPTDAERAANPKGTYVHIPFEDAYAGDLILPNIRVLGIDQSAQDIDGKPKVVATATLEVDLEQAEKLSAAAGMGSLSLALRSLTATAEPIGPQPDYVTDIQISPYRAHIFAEYTERLAKAKEENAEQGEVPAKPRPAPGPAEVRVYHGAAAAGGAAK